MALTLNGNRIGIAARLERIDEIENLRRATVEKNKERFREAMEALMEADPDGWEAWYDDNDNIPPIIRWWDTGQINMIVERIQKRIEYLSTNSF